MKPVKYILIIVITLFYSFVNTAMADIIFDFESGAQGWEIPEWSFDDDVYVGQSLQISDEIASSGVNSLKLLSDFPGDVWKASVVEYAVEVDLRGYKSISLDVFLPEDATSDLLQARIVVTAGPWFFIETIKAYPLRHGRWTTVRARLNVTEKGQLVHWKCNTKEQCIVAHLDRVRRIAVRVEYDANDWQGGKPYNGPIYIDNVVIK